MSATDVVISWFGSVPASVRSLFQRPTRFIDVDPPEGQHYMLQAQGFGWPHPLRGLLQHYGVTEPLRVAITGFSQGGQGVRALLASDDAGYIEQAIIIDGLHCGWSGGGPNAARSNICCPGAPRMSDCIGNAIAYADLCSRGAVAIGGNPSAPHYFTLTHSSIIPPAFPSTTEVAFAILDKLFGSGWPIPNAPLELTEGTLSPPRTFKGPASRAPVSYDRVEARYAAGQHGLLVIGYDNKDPSGQADHILQAQVVFPLVLSLILAPRWNAVDPSAATCAGGSIASAQCNPVAPATIPPGYMQNPGDASLDTRKYSALPAEESQASQTVKGIATGVLTAAAVGGIYKLVQWFLRQARTA